MTQHYPSEQFDDNNCPFGETRGSLLKRLIDTQRVERGGYVLGYDEGESRENEGTGRIWCITDDNGFVSNHFTPESALLALIDLSGPLHEGDATSKASEELQQEAHDLQFGGPLHPFRPFKDNAHMDPTDKTKSPHEN